MDVSIKKETKLNPRILLVGHI